MRARAIGALAAILATVTAASGVDRPIAATKLVIRAGSKKTLTFVSRDPAFLFPPVGSADDPATGTPGGAVVEIFSASEGVATLAIPPGAGTPGWKVKHALIDTFSYRNGSAPVGPSPVRAATIRQARVIKIAAKDVGLPLTGPLGSVGVRITTGTRRSCALFDGATIVVDVAGRFLARNAVAASLADCSTGALGGTTTTTTMATTSTTTTSTTTTTTSTDTTTTTIPVCGNGVVESGEQCDLPDPGTCFPSYSCGTAGSAVECQCCVASGQGGVGGCNILPCCDADDQCLLGPDSGTCVSTLCGAPGQDCLPTQACASGHCCVPLHSTSPGYTPLCQGLGVSFPCCGAVTCSKPSGLVPGGFECCVPAGGACAGAADCCSGSCNGGGTCDP
jgi:hypothetical protein